MIFTMSPNWFKAAVLPESQSVWPSPSRCCVSVWNFARTRQIAEFLRAPHWGHLVFSRRAWGTFWSWMPNSLAYHMVNWPPKVSSVTLFCKPNMIILSETRAWLRTAVALSSFPTSLSSCRTEQNRSTKERESVRRPYSIDFRRSRNGFHVHHICC